MRKEERERDRRGRGREKERESRSWTVHNATFCTIKICASGILSTDLKGDYNFFIFKKIKKIIIFFLTRFCFFFKNMFEMFFLFYLFVCL